MNALVKGSLRFRSALLLLVAMTGLSACAARHGLNMSAEDARVSDNVELPAALPVAVYVPQVMLDSRFYLDTVGAWVQPGEAMRSAIDTVGAAYFQQHVILDDETHSDLPVAMTIVLEPDWGFEGGKISMTFGYRVLDADGSQLSEGEVTRAKPMGDLHQSAGFYNASLKSSQIVMVEILNNVVAKDAELSAQIPAREISSDLLVNMEEPIRTGTAFFVSASGQLFTAAHVVDGCLVTEMEFEGDSHRVDVLAQSTLLDVALLSSSVNTDKYLPIRAEPKVVLGERVSAAGFPLQNVLANSANLTVGNVSSMKALPGSLGKFQFSAPVQPGSSGGPVISEQGELLGMTTGTLNVTALIDQGVVPQNVNFALDAKYLAQFGNRYAADLVSSDDGPQHADVAAVNEHLVASVAQLACYQ